VPSTHYANQAGNLREFSDEVESSQTKIFHCLSRIKHAVSKACCVQSLLCPKPAVSKACCVQSLLWRSENIPVDVVHCLNENVQHSTLCLPRHF
jgi:hypothetical protein